EAHPSLARVGRRGRPGRLPASRPGLRRPHRNAVRGRAGAGAGERHRAADRQDDGVRHHRAHAGAGAAGDQRGDAVPHHLHRGAPGIRLPHRQLPGRDHRFGGHQPGDLAAVDVHQRRRQAPV
ncbi:MAG: hypothetical protein AVDCRST_MAG89-4665, partial [uncultured Gemmatimonadetes bacterium]